MTTKQTPQATGAAGVFYVASELSMRGLVALPTVRNSKGADIIVTDQEGKRLAQIQVKTSKNKVNQWPIGASAASWTGDNRYYAFVRRVHGHFEVFLERAAVVARESAATDQIEERRGTRDIGPCWVMTGIYAAPGAEERTRKQWEKFTLQEDNHN